MERETARARRGEEDGGHRNWKPTLIILGAVVVVTLFVVAILVFATAPEDPAEAPDRWDSLDFQAEQDISPLEGDIDLGAKKGKDAQVIVHSAEEVCWHGYVGSEPIDGCGRAVYEVTNSPAALGLNASSESTDAHFLGVAIWDAAGDTKLHSLETKKPLDTLAITVNL